MKVIFAPNAFKESLAAGRVARAMAKGWLRVRPRDNAVEVPVADGGDGTAEAFAKASGGRLVRRQAAGPLGQPVRAAFAWDPVRQAAFIEMASASGLRLVPPHERDPMRASTRGTGQLALAALRRGARQIVIGLGGSATVDGGAGFAQALGFRLLDRDGRPIAPGGQGLEQLRHIEPPRRPPWDDSVRFIAATDVDNPLLGARGAAAVFGPQKGAGPDDVKRLEAGLARFAAVLKRDLGRDVARLPGAGAAGGFGAGLAGLLGAQTSSGIEIFLDSIGFDSMLAGAALVLTGEGRLDRQTAFGKAPMGVARAAAKAGVRAIGLAGSLGEGYEILLKRGFAAVFSIAPGPISLEEAMAQAPRLIERQAEAIARVYDVAQSEPT